MRGHSITCRVRAPSPKEGGEDGHGSGLRLLSGLRCTVPTLYRKIGSRLEGHAAVGRIHSVTRPILTAKYMILLHVLKLGPQGG